MARATDGKSAPGAAADADAEADADADATADPDPPRSLFAIAGVKPLPDTRAKPRQSLFAIAGVEPEPEPEPDVTARGCGAQFKALKQTYPKPLTLADGNLLSGSGVDVLVQLLRSFRNALSEVTVLCHRPRSGDGVVDDHRARLKQIGARLHALLSTTQTTTRQLISLVYAHRKLLLTCQRDIDAAATPAAAAATASVATASATASAAAGAAGAGAGAADHKSAPKAAVVAGASTSASASASGGAARPATTAETKLHAQMQQHSASLTDTVTALAAVSEEISAELQRVSAHLKDSDRSFWLWLGGAAAALAGVVACVLIPALLPVGVVGAVALTGSVAACVVTGMGACDAAATSAALRTVRDAYVASATVCANASQTVGAAQSSVDALHRVLGAVWSERDAGAFALRLLSGAARDVVARAIAQNDALHVQLVVLDDELAHQLRVSCVFVSRD